MMTIVILLIALAVFLSLWIFGHSMRKTLERMENEAEDAYWKLDDAKKIIEEAEIEEPKSNSSN